MPDGVYIAIISGLVSLALAILAWFRFGQKDRVEIEAQKQVTLSERFGDASDLDRYVNDRIEKALAPLRKEMSELRTASNRIHDAVRAFFTQLWVWDRDGREGPMPGLPPEILTELRLGHFLDVPFDDTEPREKR